MSNFIDQEISRIRNLVGPKGQVLGAVVRFLAYTTLSPFVAVRRTDFGVLSLVALTAPLRLGS